MCVSFYEFMIFVDFREMFEGSVLVKVSLCQSFIRDFLKIKKSVLQLQSWYKSLKNNLRGMFRSLTDNINLAMEFFENFFNKFLLSKHAKFYI